MGISIKDGAAIPDPVSFRLFTRFAPTTNWPNCARPSATWVPRISASTTSVSVLPGLFLPHESWQTAGNIGGLWLELPLQPVLSPCHFAPCVIRKPRDACVRDAELTCFSAAFLERCRKKCIGDCASNVAKPFAWSVSPYPPHPTRL